MTHRWYVAATHPLQELLAKSELEKQGVQAFLPRFLKSRVSKGREITTTEPLFPGYIFPRFNVEEERWRFINSTRGVRKLLPLWSEMPTPIRSPIIDDLLGQCSGEIIQEDEADHIVSKFIPIGSSVEISAGPLTGLTGRVKLSKKDRVQVVLEIFGRRTPVDMKPTNVVVLGDRN